MKGLIDKDDWLKAVVHECDINNWDPEVKECCTAQQFRLHLTGTPCNPWNTSATRIFTDDFLRNHADVYTDVWPVRRMVLKKTQVYIKSLIRTFDEDCRGSRLKEVSKQAKNRWERKTNVCPST